MRVQCLMRLMGLQAQIMRRKRHTTNSEHSFPPLALEFGLMVV